MDRSRAERFLYSCLNMRKHLSRTAGSGGLSNGEYLVLRIIAGAGDTSGRMGGIRAAILSDTLDMSRPAISRILNGLEGRGYIVRDIDKADRRGVSVRITEEGTAALKACIEATLGKAERIAARLGEAETETLIQLLDKLSGILRDMTEEEGGVHNEG